MKGKNETKVCVHNRFTIICGNKVVSAHNEVLDNLLSNIVKDNGYGSFVAVGTGSARNEHSLGAKALVVPTSIGECNFNAQNGTLFAVYYARITDKQLYAGCLISEAGLCCTEEGDEIVNYVTFDAVEKKEGEDLVIKVELYIEQEASASQFVCGENLLAMALLGRETLKDRKLNFAHGKNDHPNTPIYRSTSNISQTVSCTRSFSGKNMVFQGVCTSSPYEILLLIDDIPVMRAYYVSGWSSKTYTGSVASTFSLDKTVKNLNYVTSVSSDGVAVSNFSSIKYPEYATVDCVQIMDMKVTPSSRFLHEPTGAYIAVCNEKEVMVYNLYNRKATAIYKCERNGEHCALCSDGSLFMAGNGLVAYFYKSGVAQKCVFDGYNPYEVCAIKNGETYLIASRDSEGVDFLTYDGQTLALDERVTMSASGIMARVNYWFIALYNKSPSVSRAKGLFGENSKIVSTLKSFASSSSVKVMAINDSFFELYHPSLERVSVQHVEGSTKSYMATDGTEYPIVCEEIFVTTTSEKISRIDFTAGTAKSRLNLNFDSDFPPPLDIANLGDYLLFLYEEGIVTVYLTKKGVRLYFPYLASGTSVSYGVIEGNSPPATSGQTKVSLTLKIGE